MKRLVAIACLLGVFATSAAASDDLGDLFSMGGFRGKKLEKAIEKAEQHPLGSDKNPVRVNMPQGQNAYLSRLRCSDGKVPSFQLGGSVGASPFGSIVDVYNVDCGEASPGKVSVYLDMYHPQHKEDRPVSGFAIER